jgi:cytidine deaminase
MFNDDAIKHLTGQQTQELIQLALNMRQFSYAPYSQFRVGAALLGANGAIYTGCNVENASYGATNCAERTAFFKAISEGCHEFVAIAIAGGSQAEPEDYCYPCGICRQVMAEFCSADFIVYSVKNTQEMKQMTLSELLPCAFGTEKLSTNDKKCARIQVYPVEEYQ